jgi:hypothetical protein
MSALCFAGREERRRGLGPAGDGISAGFFIHPLIAIDSETEAVLGLLGAKIWTRTDEIPAANAASRAARQDARQRGGGICMDWRKRTTARSRRWPPLLTIAAPNGSSTSSATRRTLHPAEQPSLVQVRHGQRLSGRDGEMRPVHFP